MSCDCPEHTPATEIDPVSRDRAERLEPEAKKAMELKAQDRTGRLLYGVTLHSRDLRAPVQCAQCHTIYEGSLEACPVCADSTVVPLKTELAIQIQQLRKAV